MSCSLKSCDQPTLQIDENVDRVEIKAALSKSFLRGQDLKVAWKNDGNAVFHRSCWNSLIKQANKPLPAKRRRSSLNKGDGLSKTEAQKVIEAEETAEFHDALTTFEKAGEQVAKLIKQAKHCVFFTGAGISTAAGIGDYRGKDGKWTEMDRPTEDNEEDGNGEGVPYESLRPTITHEFIAKLVKDNQVKFIITQNCDDLHGLSGIPREKMSELHGNVFLEWCQSCKRQYSRRSYVLDDEASEYFETPPKKRAKLSQKPHWIKCKTCGLSHHTGGICENKGCKALLIDTIINFGDDLNEDILTKAMDESGDCDLMICFGSTITVTPASYIVQDCADRKKCRLVICNRQVTDFDADADVRIYGDCDQLAGAILKSMIGESQYNEWLEERPQRLAKYDAMRGH